MVMCSLLSLPCTSKLFGLQSLGRFSVAREPSTRRTSGTCAATATGKECGAGSASNSRQNVDSTHAADVHLKFMPKVGLMCICPALGALMLDSGALALEASSATVELRAGLDVEALRGVALLADLDPGTAQLITTFLGPVIAFFNLLFIFRIVMSWYPGIPVKKFPFFIAYNPTEPVLFVTRRLIPPVGGVDVAPVIWVALMSFANEILLGKQGLLVLLSQQQP